MRVGLPSNRSLSEDLTALGEPLNACTRMSSRLQKLARVPLHELDAVICTDLGGQQPEVGADLATAHNQYSGNHARTVIDIDGA